MKKNSDVSITINKNIDASDFRRLFDQEPWRGLGYSGKDADRVLKNLEQPNMRSAIASVEGQVAGISIWKKDFLRGDYLTVLAVDPAQHSAGIGQKLLAAFENDSFASGTNAFLCVTATNVKAIRFYEKSGYQIVGQLPGLLVKGSVEILMRKTIGPA